MIATDFISAALIHALGWTLLHALWQGALLALCVWAYMTRHTGAIGRYRTAYGALLVQLSVSALSFALVYKPDTAISKHYFYAFTQTPLSWKQQLEMAHPYIVGFWLVGMSILLLRLFGGWWWLFRLHRKYSIEAPQAWQERLKVLLRQIQKYPKIRLLSTELVRTPLTLGVFKPLIIVPLAVVNQMNPDEIDAILAHEIGHILRRDWLFNLVQVLMETLFFYHPAIWWISAQARQERENCCDDFAVGLCGNKLAYAKTLLRITELSRPAPALAMALNGPRSGLLRRRPLLLERIQRLIQPQQQKIELMEKLTATAILLAILTVLGINTPGSPLMASIKAMNLNAFEPQNSPSETQSTVLDTLTPSTTRRVMRNDGKHKIELEWKGQGISQMKMDGQVIPPSDYGKYADVIAELEQAPPPPPPAPPTAPQMQEGHFAPPPPPPAPAPQMQGGHFAPPPPPPPAPAPQMQGGHFAPPPPPPPVPAFGAQRPAPLAATPGSAFISTDTDVEGNTVIHIVQSGVPTEVRVSGNKVIVNGQEMENGTPMPLPGGQQMIWTDDIGRDIQLDGQNFQFNTGAPSSPEEMAVFERQMARQAAEMQRQAVEAQRAMLEDQRRMMAQQRKEMKEQEKELKRSQKELKKL